MRIPVSWLDVKLGVRMLARYPGLSLAGAFAIAVVVAGGIAAAAFDAVVNGGLPFPDGERIVALENWDNRASGPQPRAMHDFEAWRRDLRTIDAIGAYRVGIRNIGAENQPAEPVRIATMSASAFRIAQVPPLLGRTLLESDEQASAPLVLVIGSDEWRRRFAADPAIVGRTLIVGDTPHTVVGVMPEGFGFPERENYWVPFRLVAADYARGEGPPIYVFGRLAPNVDLAAAQAELDVAGTRAAADFPATHGTLRPRVLPYTAWYFESMRQRETLLFHFLVVLLLALVGANVAVLVYARTAARRTEIAVRTALGASRSRVVAQLFAEGLVLSGAAAVAGLAIAAIVRNQLQLLIAGAPFWVDTTLASWPVIRNVLGFAVLGAVVVGVIPALQATGRRAQTGLQHAAIASRWKVGRTYGALIVVQVALAVAILPVAIATAWQTVRSAGADPGFPADRFLTARLDIDRTATMSGDAAAEAALVARFRDRQARLVERLRAEPSVADISALTGIPGNDPNAVIEIEGRDGVHQTATSRLAADFAEIDVDVLGPLGIELIGGRMFEPLDLTATSPPVVVNATFAQRIAGGNPVGLRIRESSTAPWREIVGVISDFPRPKMAAAADARMYIPVPRGEDRGVFLLVQLRGTPSAFGNRLREVAASVDRNLQLSLVRPMTEVLAVIDTELRVVASVSGLLTVSVLLLSATGLYALMAFTVAARRREIGLRMALGSTRLRLMITMARRSLGQLAIGTALGSVLALVLFGEGELTGEQGWLMIPVVSAAVLLIGLAAAGTPIRRALRVQPTEALRDE